ncbi:benzoate 4-monooxygenase cytochrome P450 [Paraphoma chrysanthemicola]|uniref:Benzoate 4-monooxygenase cytochrome P450 n=1 Tax=Paraphoma chrysanthemicola TaxID=798071 RepID=A0A8K0RHH2_9PLEO|nr:benzoate 4-monooxygenase cytochrome P450 [Paraphoma chrysanthemicola]
MNQSFHILSTMEASILEQACAFTSLALLIFYLVTSIYCIYFHPLSAFPGPTWATFSRLPLASKTISGRTHTWIEHLHAKYGPIVRIAPDELSTVSAEAWSDIYKPKHSLPKDPYSLLPPLNGAHSLFTAQGAEHRRLRRTLTPAFTEKALTQQASIIESYVDLFVDRLRRETTTTKGESINITKYLGFVALDIISDLAFGESFHGIEGSNDHNWIEGFFLGAKFGNIRNCLNHFHPFEVLFGMLFLRLTAKNRARNWALTDANVNKRLEMGDSGQLRFDFMTPCIDNIGPNTITRRELNSNSLGFIIAGSQLPTIMLSTAIYQLLRNPRALSRLVQEVRTSFVAEDEITISSTKRLPYLRAIIMETLRLEHPAPTQLARVVPPQGHVVADRCIPGNAVIGMAIHAVQRSRLHWNDPDGFHPERFLNPEHSYHDPRYGADNKDSFHPFSMGSRHCIGYKVVLAEARVLLARICWSFELSLDVNTPVNWMDKRSFLVVEAKPLFVKLRERSSQLR